MNFSVRWNQIHDNILTVCLGPEWDTPSGKAGRDENIGVAEVVFAVRDESSEAID